MIMTHFEKWLEKETKLGLVDIKLSVYSGKYATIYMRLKMSY